MQVSAKLSPSRPSLDERISHQLAHPLISEKMVNVVAPFDEAGQPDNTKTSSVCRIYMFLFILFFKLSAYNDRIIFASQG